MTTIDICALTQGVTFTQGEFCFKHTCMLVLIWGLICEIVCTVSTITNCCTCNLSHYIKLFVNESGVYISDHMRFEHATTKPHRHTINQLFILVCINKTQLHVVVFVDIFPIMKPSRCTVWSHIQLQCKSNSGVTYSTTASSSRHATQKVDTAPEQNWTGRSIDNLMSAAGKEGSERCCMQVITWARRRNVGAQEGHFLCMRDM